MGDRWEMGRLLGRCSAEAYRNRGYVHIHEMLKCYSCSLMGVCFDPIPIPIFAHPFPQYHARLPVSAGTP